MHCLLPDRQRKAKAKAKANAYDPSYQTSLDQ